MQPEVEEIILRKYLLETLDEKEFEELDLRVIEDETFAAKLSFAESELLEDFLDNELSPEEVEVFHKHFLSLPERRQLIQEISDLRSFARREKQIANAAEESPEVPIDEKRSWFFRTIVLVPAFGALLLGSFLIWQLVAVSSLTPLEQEFASVNKRDLSDISSFAPDSTVSLFGGTLRDGGGPPKRSLTTLADPILFSLAIAAGEKTERGFTVHVYKGSNRLFTVNNLKAYKNTAGQEVRVLLPKSVFSPGQFQVRVENISAATTTNFPLLFE